MILEPYLSKIGSCLVVAGEKTKASDHVSRASYVVYFPDGSSSRMNGREFTSIYRPMTRHEKKLLEMTEAEAQIAMISDG